MRNSSVISCIVGALIAFCITYIVMKPNGPESILNIKEPHPIYSLAKNGAVHALSVNFNTKMADVTDTFTGNTVDSCGPINIKNANKEYIETNNDNSKCKLEIVDADEEILNILNSTKKNYSITITMNGERKEMIALVGVIGVFQGSCGNASFLAGNQFESEHECLTLQSQCQLIWPYLFPAQKDLLTDCHPFVSYP